MLQIPKALHSNFYYRYNLNQLESLDISSDFIAIIKMQAQSVACLVRNHFLKKQKTGWQFIDDIPTLAEQQEQKLEFQGVQFGEWEAFHKGICSRIWHSFSSGKTIGSDSCPLHLPIEFQRA